MPKSEPKTTDRSSGKRKVDTLKQTRAQKKRRRRETAMLILRAVSEKRTATP